MSIFNVSAIASASFGQVLGCIRTRPRTDGDTFDAF